MNNTKQADNGYGAIVRYLNGMSGPPMRKLVENTAHAHVPPGVFGAADLVKEPGFLSRVRGWMSNHPKTTLAGNAAALTFAAPMLGRAAGKLTGSMILPTPAEAPKPDAPPAPGSWTTNDSLTAAALAGIPLAGLLAYDIFKRKKKLNSDNTDDLSSVGPEAATEMQ